MFRGNYETICSMFLMWMKDVLIVMPLDVSKQLNLTYFFLEIWHTVGPGPFVFFSCINADMLCTHTLFTCLCLQTCCVHMHCLPACVYRHVVYTCIVYLPVFTDMLCTHALFTCLCLQTCYVYIHCLPACVYRYAERLQVTCDPLSPTYQPALVPVPPPHPRPPTHSHIHRGRQAATESPRTAGQ